MVHFLGLSFLQATLYQLPVTERKKEMRCSGIMNSFLEIRRVRAKCTCFSLSRSLLPVVSSYPTYFQRSLPLLSILWLIGYVVVLSRLIYTLKQLAQHFEIRFWKDHLW